MKSDDLLWKVLRATTNSPNDVWKPRHYERHENKPKYLLGKIVKRYTVPIKKVVDIADDEIYLVVQFCTDMLEFPYFIIDKKAFTHNLKSDEEYVYALNVRLCFRSEFKIRHRKQLDCKGEIKSEFKISILNDSINLIRDKPRHRIMSMMVNTKRFSHQTRNELRDVINLTQFDEEERIYKGQKSIKNKIDN